METADLPLWNLPSVFNVRGQADSEATSLPTLLEIFKYLPYLENTRAAVLSLCTNTHRHTHRHRRY